MQKEKREKKILIMKLMVVWKLSTFFPVAHLYNKYLLTVCFVAGTVLDTGDKAVDVYTRNYLYSVIKEVINGYYGKNNI